MKKKAPSPYLFHKIRTYIATEIRHPHQGFDGYTICILQSSPIPSILSFINTIFLYLKIDLHIVLMSRYTKRGQLLPELL